MMTLAFLLQLGVMPSPGKAFRMSNGAVKLQKFAQTAANSTVSMLNVQVQIRRR